MIRNLDQPLGPTGGLTYCPAPSFSGRPGDFLLMVYAGPAVTTRCCWAVQNRGQGLEVQIPRPPANGNQAPPPLGAA